MLNEHAAPGGLVANCYDEQKHHRQCEGQKLHLSTSSPGDPGSVPFGPDLSPRQSEVASVRVCGNWRETARRSGRSSAVRAPALGAGSRRFESFRPDTDQPCRGGEFPRAGLSNFRTARRPALLASPRRRDCRAGRSHRAACRSADSAARRGVLHPYAERTDKVTAPTGRPPSP